MSGRGRVDYFGGEFGEIEGRGGVEAFILGAEDEADRDCDRVKRWEWGVEFRCAHERRNHGSVQGQRNVEKTLLMKGKCGNAFSAGSRANRGEADWLIRWLGEGVHVDDG